MAFPIPTLSAPQQATPLAIISESVQQRIVADISSALRRELGASLSSHLKPVLSALDECRTILQKHQSVPLVEKKRHDAADLVNATLVPVNTAHVDAHLRTRTLRTASLAYQSDGEEGKEHNEHGSSWRLGLLNSRQSKDGYQPLSTKDDGFSGASPHHGDAHYDSEGRAWTGGVTDPEAARLLSRQILELQAEKTAAAEKLADVDTHWASRRDPYENDVRSLSASIAQMQCELDEARRPRAYVGPPPGPMILRFVDGTLFHVICNVIVVLNLVCMALAPHTKGSEFEALFHAFNEAFLFWYLVELLVKTIYHQKWLFLGKCSVVWWNWLDLFIVTIGVVDQWILPLFAIMSGGKNTVDTLALTLLRTLKLFRIIRFLKLLRAFLQSDLAWTEGLHFEALMSAVIAANAIIMSLEVDVPWAGWVYVENFLLVVYSFELSLRLKKTGCEFFTSCESWNYLDLVMVVCGAMDLWLMPLVHCMQQLIYGDSDRAREHQTRTGIFKVLTLMRLVRVLRLVKLLRMVKPLYRLMLGVMESLRAMQWVIVLTMLVLYACAVVFTNLVGKGLVTQGEISADALEFFGSVPRSLFSLFKLMNGDLSVVTPIADYVQGQLLFAGFMIVANWAVLAILTSVVSDNMIATSKKANDEDERKMRDASYESRVRRLKILFAEMDQNGNSYISSSEWHAILKDAGLRNELLQATGLTEDDVNTYFEYLSEDGRQMMQAQAIRDSAPSDTEKQLDYNTFISSLKDDGQMADKRSVLQVTSQLRRLENRLDILLHTG